MSDKKLAAVLDEIRGREQATARGPWMVTAKASEDSPVIYVAGPVENSAHVLFEADWGSKNDAEFIAAARADVPRLLAALDGVLKRHAPDRDESSWCAACGFSYPCMTVRDISRHLLGEDGSGE